MKNKITFLPAACPSLRISAAALMLACLTFLNQSGQAVTVYWDVNGATAGASGTGLATGTWDGLNTFFNTDSTGAGGGTIAAWNAGDTLIFGAGTNATNAYTVTVSGTQGIGGLTVEEGAVTLTGGTLQMTANSNFDVASGLTSTINSTIDGGFDLTKLGGGTLVLGGTNTYTGKTLINAGTLSISADSNLGTAPGGVVADSINFTGSSALQITGTGNPTINSNRGITLNGGVTGTVQVVSAANTVAYGGIVTGAAGTTFKKTGAGTMDLQGNSTAAFAGALTIDGGTLKLSGNGEMAGTSGVTISNRGTLTLDNTATNLGNRTAGALSSSGGTINFLGNAAATTETLGALTLNAGALTINSTTGGGGNTLTIPSITRSVVGGTLYLNNDATSSVVLGTAPALVNSILKYTVVNNGSLTSFANYPTSAGTNQTVVPLALASHAQGAETTWSAATVNARPSVTVPSAAGATRTLYTLTLDNGVNITAPTTSDRTINISGGVLQTGGTSSVASTSTLETIFAFGANEALFHVLGTLQLDRGNTNTLTGSGGFTKSGAGTLILNGVSTLAGAFNVNEGILEVRAATSLMTTAAVANLNGATLRLSNDTATTYIGNWVVNADSTIQVDRVTAAATATTHQIGTLNIGGGRTLSVNSNDITSGTAYGLTTAALTLNAGGATIDVANNGVGTGTMIVTSVAGAFPLIKMGAGDLLENSVSAGYAGPVEIQAGRVGWGGSTGTFTEAQTFSGSGGILKSGVVVVNLSGTNTFTGGVTVNGGTLGFSTASNNGGSASNLGQGTDGISLGGGNLSFIGGTNQSTNRAMTLTAASTLSANGTSGAGITYAGAISAAGNTLTLTGTGAGSLTGGLTQTGTAADLTVNAGNWTISGGLVTVADDVTVVGSTAVLNLNTSGGMFFIGGGTTLTDSTLNVQNGAVVNLGANDVSPTDIANGGVDRLLIGQATVGAVGTLNTNTFNLTSGRLDLGQVIVGLEGAITGTGTITITSDFNLYRGTVNANLAGAAAVEKFGLGTVTFGGDNSGLTSATAVRIDSGLLALNFATSNTDKLRSATGLDMRGGFLSMSGNSSAPSTQTVASLTLANGGASKISLTSNGFATTLNLGAITRAALANDGAMRFELPALGAITTTNANNNATSNGILGGWATVNDGTGVFFARNDGANNIVAANTTLQDDLTLWTAGANMSDSAGFIGTLADCFSINSLRFNANAASAVTIPAGGVLNIASGGVFMTSAAATGAHSISGGVLTSGTGELIFTQDSIAQGLTVSSSIVGASGITKTGNGTLTLSGSNTSSGITDIQAGTVIASGGNAIGDNSAVTLSDDQVSTLQITGNETLGSIAGGNATTGQILGTVDFGANTLTLRGGAAYAGVFTGSGAMVKNTGLNTANMNISGISSGFTGTVTVDGGLFQMSGVGQLNASSFTVNKGGSLLFDNLGATRSAARVLDTTPITLNSADGASSGATVVRGLWIRTDQAATTSETIGELKFNSGANYLSGEASGTTGIAAIIADNFTRSNNATVDARGRAMGATASDRNQFRIGTAGNQTTFIGTLVGGGGAAATQNISIVPWGIGETLTATTTDTNMGNSLITYVSGAGFRALDFATEYDTIALAAATDNARASLSGADLTGLVGTTVNALVLHNADAAASTRAVTGTGAGQALAVTSGTMLFTRDTAGAGAYGINLGGFNSGITVGATNEYVIFVINPDSNITAKTLTATINSPLTSTADITKSGRGTLVLGTANTAGGNTKKTTINEGTLQIGDLDHIGGGTGGLVFAGGTLQLGSTFDVSTDDVSTRTISFLNGGGTLDTNGKNPIFANSLGSGSGSFTKTGAGNLTLNAATTLTGGTTITTGEITLGASNAIGTGDLNIAAGADLNLGIFNVTVGNVTTADSATNPITGSGTITASGSTILNRGTFAPILAGTTNLIKNTAAQTVTMSSASNSFTGFTQVVDGTLAIASIGNAGVNSPIGAPTGDNAAIRLGSGTTSGILSITGAAMSTDRPIWLLGTTGGGTIDKDGTGELTLNADIKGIGVGAKTLTLQGTTGTLIAPNVLNGEICELASIISLNKAEAGVWSLPNANTYSGTTTLTLGTLMIGNNGSLGTGTISFAGGVLDNSGGNRTLANAVSMGGTGTLQGTGDFSFTGNFSETGGSRTLNINNVGTTTIGDSSADTLTLAENNQARTLTLAVAATSPTIINATIQDGTGTGTDNLTKSGAGTLTINAANTYGSAGVGQTNLSAGTIIAGNDAAFGTSLINVTAASAIEASATRALANNLQLNSTTAFSLTLGGSSALAFNGNIAQIGNSHTIAITNSALTTFGDASSDTLTLAENNQARTLTLDVGAGGLTINSTIVDGTGTGADNLIKAGSGTMTLNASSIYTGTTALQNGSTILGGGAADRLPTTTALTLGTGTNSATLQLGNGSGASNQTLTSLATSGTGTSNAIVGGNASNSTLTVNQATNTTFSGNLGGAGGNQNNLNLAKSGVGELIVSGTSTYAGTTAVNGGKLFIDSTTGFPATNNTSLTVADGAEFSLRGTALTGNVSYGFAGTGNVITLGSGTGTATLGFRLDGGFNTQLALATNQTMTVTAGTTFQTAVYVDDAPTAGQGYVLINGTDPGSLHAGGGSFNFTPVLFNGGSFTYTLTNETLLGTVDRWVITPTVQAAAADVWWKGDLTGLGTGVWTATTTNVGNESNWDSSQSGGADALVPPDLNSIVHFSATGAGNFATTLGGNLTIESLIFHPGATDISVGGANTLTIGNTIDPAGITMQAGAPTNVSFSANVALAQAQSFNIADSGDILTFTGGLSGTGALGINDNGSSTGTMVLGGASGLATYTGATNLVTGRLNLLGGASNRLPTTTDLTMGNATLSAVLQLGDATGASNTAIGNLNTGAATANSIVGGFTTASILSVTQTSAGTFNGVIGGAGTNENQVGISKSGSATLILNGANTYTGASTITNGAIQLGATGSINGTTSLAIIAGAGNTAVFDVNGRTAVLGGAITLGGGSATSQANIIDTATGGLLTLGGNVTFDGTNNPLGSTIGVNIDAGGTARTIIANDSTSTATELTIGAPGNTLVGTATLTFDGTGAIVLNSATTISTGTTNDLQKNGTGTLTLNATTAAVDDWLINVGVINATVSNALNASDDIVIDGTGVADSAVVNISGTAGASGVSQGDDIFIRNGGRVNVTVNNGISTGTDQILIGDSVSVGAAAARLDLAANIGVGANGIQLGATGGNVGNITGTGTITTAGTYSLRNGSIASGINLAGAGGITKVGAGTVTFSGERSATGATAIQEGSLILDYTTNNNSKIGGVLTLGAPQGNLNSATGLTLNGNASAPTSQSVTSTTISNTGNVLVDLNEGAGQSVSLALGAITRTVVGGTVNFDLSSAANATVTTTNPATGALGWATVTTGGTTRIGAISGGNIVQATTTTQNSVAAWGRLQNIINTAAYTGTLDPDCNTIASLTFDAAAASTVTIGSGSTLIITSGGILVNSGVGANPSTITGGSILGSTAAPLGELMIHQNNTSGSLIINSDIINSSGITKSGLGALVLGGTNTFLSGSRLTINEGTVQLSGGAAIGDSTIVIMRSGTTLDLNNSNETIGNLGVDTTNLTAGTIDLGSGTLTVNQTASSTFAGTMVGTGNLVKNSTGTLTFTGNNTFSGSLTINGGNVTVNGAGGFLTSVGTFTLNAAEFLGDQNDTTERDRVGSGADFILNNTAGTNGLFQRTNQGNTKTENIGDIRIGAGHNVVTSHGSVTSAISVLQADTLSRLNTASQNHGTALMRGNNLGASSGTRGTIAFDSGAQATVNGFEVGGGGAAASLNISIIPWLVGDLSETGLGNTFVTNVDATIGLRPLASTEYTTNAAGFDALTGGAASTNNVRFDTGATLTGTATAINSLVIDAATGQIVTGPASSIEITSGAILAASSGTTISHTLGGFTGITTGGGRDYNVYVTSTTGTLTISSPLTSAVPLVKAGAGTLSLTAAGTGNVFTDLYLNQGAVLIDDLDRVNGTTNTIHFQGGGLRLAAGFDSSTDDISAKPWNINTGGGTLDVSLVTANSGVVTLVNGIDDSSGGTGETLTVITRSAAGAGRLVIQGSSSFQGTTVFNHTAVDSASNNSVILNGTTNAALNGNVQIGSLGTIPNTNVDVVVALGASEQIVDTASITFRGSAGEQAYFKLLGFTETVAGISDSTANGIVSSFETGDTTPGGPSTLIVNSSSDFSFNGFFRDTTAGATSATAPLSLTKQGAGTQTLSGTEVRHSGATTITAGALTLTDVTNWQSAITNNATLNINQTTGSRNQTQVISGSGTVNKRGAGTIVIPSTTTNLYSGQTNIEQGVLSISTSAGLGDASATNTIRIANNATLQSTGANVDLTANRAIAMSGVGATIDVTSTNILTVSGLITGDDCQTLTKTGTGMLVMNNASNSFASLTNVTAGVLQVGSGGTAGTSGAGQSGTGLITVASGAALAGSGTVQAPVVLNNGATLHVGEVTSVNVVSGTSTTNNRKLTFTAVSGTNFQAGSTTKFDITTSSNAVIDPTFNGNDVGTSGYISYVTSFATQTGDHDRLVFTNANPTLAAGAEFIVSPVSFTAQVGQIFNLVDWASVVTGFAVGTNYRDGSSDGGATDDLNLPDISNSGYFWDISLFQSNGIVVVVPEPGRVMLLLFGFLGLFTRRRRAGV